jgi:type I restriction enzyme S subunit
MRWESGGECFDDCVVFFKVDEVIDGLPVGGLSNMSNKFPLTIDGVRVRSTETLYQALRFPHQPNWQEEILAAPHAMRAKMAAKKEGRKKDHSRPDWEEIQVEVMRWCLRVKLAQHYQDFFVRLLDWTGHRPIVERSKKDRFWGAVLGEDGVLRGTNQLGRLLVELRESARALRAEGREAELLRVEPPPIENFLLLGQPIGVVEGTGVVVRR